MNVEATPRLCTNKQIYLFFALCWGTYFSTYLGRLNFTASMAEICIAEGFGKAQLGLAGSGFFFGYGIFQLLSGFLGEKLDPVRMVFTGAAGSGLINLIMAGTSSPLQMTVLWTLNGVFQSTVWAPMLRMNAEYLEGNVCTRACVHYATTTPIGTVCAYLLTAGMISMFSWRAAFVVSGLTILVIAVLWMLGMRHLLSKASLLYPIQRTSNASPARSPSMGRFLPFLCILCTVAVLNGALKDSIISWLPSFLSDIHGLPTVSSLLYTSCVPLVTLTGVYLGSWLCNSFLHSEARTCMLFFTVCTVALFLLTHNFGRSSVLSITLFTTAAAALLAVNTMIVTLIPVRLKQLGRTSSLTGILNSATYIGSTLSVYGGGLLIETAGWHNTLLAWCLISGFGVFVSFFAIRTQNRLEEQ